MNANFARALPLVLRHEGGFVNHPSDPGGATNKGITIATFRKWVKRNGTVADLKAITDQQVAKIYRKHYWDKVKGDDLPAGIDYVTFDFAVNSGPRRAAKFLQEVLRVKADGVIGPVTIEAARRAPAINVIHALCDRRLDFLRRLKTWPVFKDGWQARVLGVRNDALHMAAQAAPTPSPLPKPTKTTQAAPDANTSKAGGIASLIAAAALLAAGLITGALENAWQWLSHLF